MKKCAVFNDISGFGKCSLAVAMPVISAMGIEVHPIPTAVLTNQTDYNNYSSYDLTCFLPSFTKDWAAENVQLDGILTGYMGSTAQIKIVSDFISRFRGKHSLLVVDPVMADNQNLYDGFDNEKCLAIKSLAAKADIITPNVTELAILAESEYTNSYDIICENASAISKRNNQKVIVTGVRQNEYIHTLVISGNNCFDIKNQLFDGSFSGTGDILSSVVTAGVLNGLSAQDATSLACGFISNSIKDTKSANKNDGICFEKHLGELII